MINQKNYISHINRLGFENLPDELKQAHLVIMTKTDNGRNWKSCEKDKELKELVNLTFKKLQEYISSKGKRSLNGLDGHKKHKSEYEEEAKFFRRILALEGKQVSKKNILKLIDDLQAAIVSRKIGKDSPFAAEINYLQEGLVAIYNKKSEAQVLQFNLKKETVQKLKEAIEASKQYEKRIFPAAPPDKVEAVDLRGIENVEEEKQDTEPEETVQGNEQETGQVMNSVDFSKLEFDSIGLKDKWLKLIGDPAPGFSAMVFGKPKMGKSYLCVDFAGYLARNHGPVLYVAREEKLDATLQKKLRDKDVAHPNLFVSDYLPEDLSPYDYVFIDSVNKMGLSPQDIETLRKNNHGKSFIFVFQTTKEGNFRGTNEFQHDVDVVIEVPEKGKAVQFGRFNQGGEMGIFDNSEPNVGSLSGIAKKATGKEISITSELGIPLEELAMELLDENQDKSEIINVIYKQTAKVEKAVLAMVKNEIKEQKLNISVEKATFTENDSDKIATGASYFEVVLKGKTSDLKKIAGADKLFFYDWKNQMGRVSKKSLRVQNKKFMLAGNRKKMEKSKYPAWTRPSHLNAYDHEKLQSFFNLYASGNFEKALKFTDSFDTILREEIPVKIWKEIGGKLTKSGEAELKKSNSEEMMKKLKKYHDRTDDLNPNYMFSTIATQILCEAEKGDFDILYLVRRELANRGVDKNGKWIGFPAAKKVHGVE